MKINEFKERVMSSALLESIDFELFEEVYIGKDGCRCGCRGNYYTKRNPYFKNIVTKCKNMVNNHQINIKDIDIQENSNGTSGYADFPYGINRCICFYYKEH